MQHSLGHAATEREALPYELVSWRCTQKFGSPHLTGDQVVKDHSVILGDEEKSNSHAPVDDPLMRDVGV